MDLLLSPLSWCVLAVTGWLLVGRLKTRPRRRDALHGALGMLLVTGGVLLTPFGANLLVRLVEDGLPRPADCVPEDRAPIVVVSGGFAHKPRDAQDFTALSPDSQWRLRAGALRALAQPETRLIISGGRGQASHAEAQTAVPLLQALGVPTERIEIEPLAENTLQNAQRVKALLNGASPQVQLVTSALHLPRASLAFERAGLRTCSISSGSVYVPWSAWRYFFPQSSAITKSQAVLHELVGYARTRWLPMPAPASETAASPVPSASTR